jgi:hypothetical protein
MKHVLLATTALSLSAGFAAAEVTVSWSGKANAGISSATTTTVGSLQQAATTTSGNFTYYDASEDEIVEVADGEDAVTLDTGDHVIGGTNGTALVAATATTTSGAVSTASSGIDLNFSASVTTDSGITITVADDFGGGSLIDWNDDNAVEAQTSDLDQPAVTVAMAGVTVTIDPGQVSDLYDDSQTGDVQISTSMAGFSIDYVASQDTDANTNSYKLGYAMGDLSLSVIGTTRGDAAVAATADSPAVAAENDAMKWSASYKMGDITLGLAMNNNGDNDDVTTGSVSYAMGNGLSVSLSADDNDDWDASATWTSAGMSVTYSTDESSDWSAYGSYALGNGASLFASTAAANDWSAFGVEFTF